MKSARVSGWLDRQLVRSRAESSQSREESGDVCQEEMPDWEEMKLFNYKSRYMYCENNTMARRFP